MPGDPATAGLIILHLTVLPLTLDGDKVARDELIRRAHCPAPYAHITLAENKAQGGYDVIVRCLKEEPLEGRYICNPFQGLQGCGGGGSSP